MLSRINLNGGIVMKVSLLSYTPEPEKIVASAAKLCYSQSGVEDIKEKLTDEQTQKFLSMLMDLGHMSTIEHVSFTFAIEGVSRVLTHQLVRHRIASYSQQSQRYVKLEQFEYIMPPAIERNKEAKAVFMDAMEKDQESYNKITDILFDDYYKTFVADGMDEKNAKNSATKKAIEDARFVFPNACETKILVTMNARSLMHFFAHRCCERAQWEIRDMATLMLSEVKMVAPTIFSKSGPSCMSGKCPEGIMTCGRIVEIREKFKSL